MKVKNGFTLTELLITIAIIGILAAIALPRYLQNETARVSEAVSQLSAIKFAEENYKISNGNYLNCNQFSCWNTMGVDDPGANPQRYFDYEVKGAEPPSTPPVFCAIARRNVTGNPDVEFAGKTICMDNTGAYFGDHPNGPGFHQPPNVPNAGTGCVGLC